MPDINLAEEWKKGFDNAGPDLNAAVRDAVNIDFDQDGNMTRRGGLVLLSPDRAHSLWSNDFLALCVVGGVLNSISSNGNLTALLTLPSNEPVWYCDHLNGVIFSSVDAIGFYDGSVASFIGPPDAVAPQASSAPVGGMYPGVYAVAASYLVGGVEGAISTIAQVNVPPDGGIRLTLAINTADLVRIYRSDANGDALYWVADIPSGISSYLIGASPLGRLCETRHLRRMCGGAYVKSWNGRLLVARGNALHFSEPMNYGLTSPRHGFVQFEKEVTFIECVSGGVFIGQPDRVIFLSGSKPKEWSLTPAARCTPVPGSSILIDAATLDPQSGISGLVACWLCEWGFAIGTAQGQVIFPQQKRVRLPNHTGGRTVLNDNRLTTFAS